MKKPHGDNMGKGQHAVRGLKYFLAWISRYRSGALEIDVTERAKSVSQMVSGRCDIIIDTTQALEDCVQIFLDALPWLSCPRIVQMR